MANVADETDAHAIPDVIRIVHVQVRSNVDEVVRSTVEEKLNGLLVQEAERLCMSAHHSHGAPRSGWRRSCALSHVVR